MLTKGEIEELKCSIKESFEKTVEIHNENLKYISWFNINADIEFLKKENQQKEEKAIV